LAYKLLSPFKEEGLNFLVQEYENHVARTLNDQINPAKLTPASFVEIVCAKHAYFQQFADEVFEGSQDLNDGYRRVSFLSKILKNWEIKILPLKTQKA
jgi:hypothetical protein